VVLLNDWSAREVQRWEYARWAVPGQGLPHIDLALGGPAGRAAAFAGLPPQQPTVLPYLQQAQRIPTACSCP
jgi:hypothetical protein